MGEYSFSSSLDAVKNGVADLCTDLDDMFKSMLDIFKKGQLGVEVGVC